MRNFRGLCLQYRHIYMSVRRVALYRLAVCMLLLFMVACGAGVPAPTQPTSEPGGSVTLLLWHGWAGADRLTLGRLVDRFNRMHPEGRVSLQAVPLATFVGDLRSAAITGSGPHMALIPNTWVGALATENILLPLDDDLSQAEQQELLPVTLSGAKARSTDGTQRLYSLPIRFDTLALYYNTANLLSPPADTATMINSARGLSDARATPPIWGMALNLSLDNTIGYLYAFGGRIFDDNGQLVLADSSRAPAEQWLTWLNGLNTDQQMLVRVDSGIAVDRELKNGHALMTFDWSHQIGIYRNLWGDHLGVAPLPRLSETDQPPRGYVRSDVLAVNNRVSAAERHAAIAFLRYMVSDEVQMILVQNDIQPVRRNLVLDGDTPQFRAARAFRTQADQGLPMPNNANRLIVEQELRFMERQVLLGLASPADALTEADRRLRQRLVIP